MPTILGANTLSGGFNVANSVRLEDGYFTRQPSSSGSNTTWTFSCWLKRSVLGIDTVPWGTGYSSPQIDEAMINIGADNKIRFNIAINDTTDVTVRSGNVLRDVAAWYHIVVACDTTQGTASNRVKFYINGVQDTNLDTEDYPTQNQSTFFGDTNKTQIIGQQPRASSNLIKGYLAEVVYIDGTALDPTSFGEFDEDTPTIWKPIAISGLTFGTNGFYHQYKQSGTGTNASGFGADTSGNGNHFASNNLAATDQSTDTCTNNYATLNSALPLHSSSFTEGNLKWTPSTASQYYWANSTFGVSQGKWYMEAKLTTAADHNVIGIANDQAEDNTSFLSGSGGVGDSNVAYQYGYKNSNGQSYNNASGSSYGNTYAEGDIIGMYVDLDNNKIYWAKNGTLQNSGTGVSITDPGSIPGGVYFLAVADGTSSNSSLWEVNFGGTNTYSISSGNTDDNGYGNFEYSPNITGDGAAKSFYALNTKNIAEFG